jgi:catechol 2,3-dioxygenase-like lactoylglutathione lyase family enzyme
MANSYSDVRGIEHVGITVPNLGEATKYFADVLGAIFVYDVLKEPDLGEDLERTLGVPKGSVVKQVRLLRLGDGANIELFEYSAEGQRIANRPCDFGLQHFAVFVDDMEAVAERVRKAGGRVLNRIQDLPNLDGGANNRYVYTNLPWGGTMELISIPNPQNYEATTSVRKWKPDPHR